MSKGYDNGNIAQVVDEMLDESLQDTLRNTPVELKNQFYTVRKEARRAYFKFMGFDFDEVNDWDQWEAHALSFAKLLGYSSYQDMNHGEHDAVFAKLEMLAGPHSHTLFKALIARQGSNASD